MADEILKIDANNKNVSGAVTDDASQFIKMLRIDDTTKGLKVSIVGGGGTGTVTSISQGTGILLSTNPLVATGTVSLATSLQPMATLTGKALQFLRVNAGETAVEYSAESGLGTVTSVSVTTANGVSGSVATATTTPAITLTLGAITPTTVNGLTFTSNAITTGGSILTINGSTNGVVLTGTPGGVTMNGAAFVPNSNDSIILGGSGLAFSDLFLASGGVINWNADMTITHSADTLTFAGGTVALGTATATGGLTGNITGNASGTSATVTGAAQAAITTAVNLPWTGLKPGTDGEIPTFDSSGNPAFVATGTATHVLTSNGAGAAPTFQAAGGGGPVTAVTVSISSANILGMFVTPVEVLAAPGAGKVRIIDEVVFSFTVGTQYANGGNVRLQYDGDTANILNDTFETGSMTGASSLFKQLSMNLVTTTAAIGTDKAIKITNASGAFITGTGTLKLFILYRDITL